MASIHHVEAIMIMIIEKQQFERERNWPGGEVKPEF